MKPNQTQSVALGITPLLFLPLVSWWFRPLEPIPPKIDKQTTYLTEPVRKDGTIDYLAAMKQRASEGVTPKNNAFIGIARTMGNDNWSSPEHRQFVFNELGIDPPDDKQPRFVDFETFAKERGVDMDAENKNRYGPGDQASNKQADKKHTIRPGDLIEKPWHNEDAPLVGSWLKQNKPVLARVKRTMDKSGWYAPLWSNEPPEVLNALLPWLGAMREEARALAVEGQRHVAAGDLDQAWRDVMTIRRMGIHVSSDGPLISELVGFSLVNLSSVLIQTTASSPKLKPEQARGDLADLKRLSRLRPLYEAIDFDERIISLAAIVNIWRETQTPGKPEGFLLARNPQLPSEISGMFNPNIALRQFNDMYDRLIRLGKIQSYPKYKKRAEKVGQQFTAEMKAKSTSVKTIAIMVAPSGIRRGLTSETITNLLMGIMAPALDSTYKAQWHARMQDQLNRVALALGGYRAKHGKYPKSLDALSPQWLDQVPEDLFIEKPLHYQRHGPLSVTVYSVGPNMQDDGGKGIDEGEDDVVVRLDVFKSSESEQSE